MTSSQAGARAVRAMVDAVPAPDRLSSMSVVGWLHRLCTAVVRALPAEGAGISVMTEQGAGGVAAASDAAARALEELQFTLGEGPCLDAFSSRGPVLEPDLVGARQRWPGYAPAAGALGVCAVFAFPLQVGAARLGVLDVYRTQAGSLAPASVTLALTFAEVALDALLDAQATSGEGRVGAEMAGTLDAHNAVYQAQGMVMMDLSISLKDALARLRAYAFARDRPLQEVAQDVVAGHLRMAPDPSRGPPGPREPPVD